MQKLVFGKKASIKQIIVMIGGIIRAEGLHVIHELGANFHVLRVDGVHANPQRCREINRDAPDACVNPRTAVLAGNNNVIVIGEGPITLAHIALAACRDLSDACIRLDIFQVRNGCRHSLAKGAYLARMVHKTNVHSVE